MSRTKQKSKKVKAYSIIELLVTLAIFGIIISMLLQSLFLNIRLTTQINLRSRFNTDLNQLVSLIERDIKNADFYYPSNDGTFIKGCLPLAASPNDPRDRCTLNLNSVIKKWERSTTSIIDQTSGFPYYPVKRTSLTGVTQKQDYISSNILNISMLEFVVNTSEVLEGEARLANILVTIKAKPTIETWTTDFGINEQVRQISVSTRNYQVKL